MSGSFTDFLSALGQNESGNNYSFVSSLNYLGRFQFGEEALQAVGFYNADGTWARDFVGSWTETAHQLGVWDKASFLASPAAQDAAMQAWLGNIHGDLQNLNLLGWVGQTVGGVTVTLSGLLAGAHLVGVWNLKDFLTSGGAMNMRDGYGTPVSEYVQRFGGFDTPFGGGSAPSTPAAPSTPSEITPWGGGQVLQGGSAADALYGGDGPDTIAGGAGQNLLRGGNGDDVLRGGWEFDDLHGNAGNDTVEGGAGGDWVVGGQGSDRLLGEDGDDVVLGNQGADTLDGGAGADIVRGGQGDDLVQGGAGDDWVAGDLGTDVLTGGEGADRFHFFQGAGADRVTDFHYWEGDRVDLFPDAPHWAEQSGADTVLHVGDSTLTLVGVQLSSLPSDWII